MVFGFGGGVYQGPAEGCEGVFVREVETAVEGGEFCGLCR